jgi:hypothetical protein
MGKRGQETVRSPAGAVVVVLTGAPRCEATRSACRRSVLMVKIRQPSHEFTFGVGMSFIPYPLVLTPVV